MAIGFEIIAGCVEGASMWLNASDIEIALRRLAPRIPAHEFGAVVDHAVDSPGLKLPRRRPPHGCPWSPMCGTYSRTTTSC